ncbi:MAG: hypothetical protein KDE19_20890, partial [Caldilineaceae bacterium]|nr:hypothetical protein [Caldilineaceae bacterium]
FHEGNMTYKSPGILAKVPGTFLEVSHKLADAEQLQNGDWVRVASKRGSLELQVLVSDEVTDHELYLPMHSSERPVNMLTSNEIDVDSHTPAYKEVAVKLEKLNKRGDSPLGRNHHRFGNPTPQSGVEVERKWARADYRFPTEERPADGKV